MVNYDDFDSVSKFIKEVLDGKANGKRYLELPEQVNRTAERVLGHSIVSHRIGANEIRHTYKNHGVGGMKIDKDSIPLRKEDVALMPYIMASPDRIEKGNPQTAGVESIKYIKHLSNGVVVVVEREGRFDVEDMEQITMWANKKSLSPYDVYAPASSASHATSETLVISPKDTTKIMQDFEKVKQKAQKNEPSPLLAQIMSATEDELRQRINNNNSNTLKL